MKYGLCFVFLSLWVTNLPAQKSISVDDFTINNTFELKSLAALNWMKDGKYYTTLESNQIVKYNIATGMQEAVVFDGSALSEKLEIQEYRFSDNEQKILIATDIIPIYRRSYTAQYYVYDVVTKSLGKLSEGGKQSYATFSPNSAYVAFVRGNNLYYRDLEARTEVQVTTDGKPGHIINGATDWVYEEEFNLVAAFSWSPDSKRLAYLRFDESNVKEYNMQVWGKNLYPSDYRIKYPKAGESNSVVDVAFYDLTSRETLKARIAGDKDCYIPRVKWTLNPELLAVRKLNRLQNKCELIHISALTGETGTIISESSDTYIDLKFTDEIKYLKDGRHFIATNESSGFKHLYLYTMAGRRVRQITKGDFEVTAFIGMDEKSGTLYYSSTESSPWERHLYSISVDGTRKMRLTREKGVHSVHMSPDFRYYVDHFSSLSVPKKVALYNARGNRFIRVMEANTEYNQLVREYDIVQKEMFFYEAGDKTRLAGYFLKPKNMEAGKRYPLLLYQYSGPGSQNVSESWGGNHFYFHQMLAHKGYIIAVLDTRGTGARGERFKKCTYLQLGKLEIEDIVSAADYFRNLPFVDADRMGIWGWSYGGFIASLAMTKAAGTFRAGIAVAPVTNWRFYNTVYSERYLQTPQLNPEGYDLFSPISYAKELSGNFMLIHGTGDHNVHFQNSVALEEALVNAGKHFRTFYYPDKHHGIQGPKTRLHLYTMMLEFIQQNL